MGASRRHRPRTIDIRGDFHGHVHDYACGDDRRWFEEHPGETVRHRAAHEHELCDPRRLPQCVPLVDIPAAGSEVRVEVRQVAPGLRTRGAYLVLPGAAA